MENLSLKKAFMGGYTKKSVLALLEELSSEKEAALASLSEEKGKLLDKIAALEDEIVLLNEKVSNAEKEKDFVSSAIVSAEKEAAKILSDAARQADELRSLTERELDGERAQILDFRTSLMQAMELYKEKLDNIALRSGLDSSH